jgi:hypothetical protein
MRARTAALPVLDVVSARDLCLARDGWARRSVAGPPRLQELVDMYRQAGFEVRLEPVSADDLAPQCADCSMAHASSHMIYTRQQP